MSDELERYTMRTAMVQDGILMKAKCLVHADCRAKGKMVFPSGRAVHLKTKTGDIKDLNANFVSHLVKRDVVDGTSHADTWRSGLIHGPRAHFTVPYDGEARASDSEVREERADMEVDAAPDPQRDTVIALAAARTAATASSLSIAPSCASFAASASFSPYTSARASRPRGWRTGSMLPALVVKPPAEPPRRRPTLWAFSRNTKPPRRRRRTRRAPSTRG